MSYASRHQIDGMDRGGRVLSRAPMFDHAMRTPVIRQDRIPVGDDDCRVRIDEVSYQVLDFSPFGLAVHSDNPFLPAVELSGVPFYFNGIEVARLGLRVVRQEPMDGGGYKVGFNVVGEPLSVEYIMGLRGGREIVASFDAYLGEREKVPAAFRKETLEIKELMQDIEARVSEMEERFAAEYQHNEEMEAMESSVIPVIGQLFQQHLDPMVERLAHLLNGLDKTRIQSAYEFFRAQLGPVIYQSPFSHRSLNKPLGYAGDYEMMNMIYSNRGVGRSLFARCLHFYIINMPGGKAVRNRAVYLHRKLNQLLARVPADRPIRVLSVASGPARELQMLFASAATGDLARTEFHLLDQDIHSLKHAQRRLRELALRHEIPCNIKLFHSNIKKVITEGLEEDDYDLIYSAGLFDYFSEPVAYMAAKQLFNALKPGGQVVIGNFNVTNPSRFFMEMAWDWNLVYRSEEELMRLGRNIGGDPMVEREEQNINLFLVIGKGNRA